jgi:AraC-like DNA-binding protein
MQNREARTVFNRQRFDSTTSAFPSGDGGRRSAIDAGSGRAESVPRVDCDVLESVFESPSVRLAAWRCATRHADWSEERVHTFDGIAFPRDVPFAIRWGADGAVADPGVVLLHSAGVPYRTRHPFGVGDRGVVLIPRREIAIRDSSTDRSIAGFAACRVVPRSPRAHLLQEILFRRAAGDDPAAVDELSALLAAEVLRAASGAALPASPRLAAAVERVRLRLSRDFDRKIGLAEIAADAGYSPFHLARGFRQLTGVTLRRYRIRARLFAALPRILEPGSDLMDVAVEIGFSSHSHLTAAFREEFRLSPSEARRLARQPSLAVAAALAPTAT